MAVHTSYCSIGWDGCGKTEISKQLASIFGWTYFKNSHEGMKFSNPDEAKLGFKYETNLTLNFMDQLDYTNRLILDRGIPCEYAYAKALNRDFDEDLVWHYDAEFAKRGTKLIYCYKTVQDSFTDEHVKFELKESVEKYYEEYLAKTKMKFVKVDTTSQDLVLEFAQIFKSGIIFDDYDEE